MAESSRIEELRRRVQLDPASIAFAALAEEYRRAGRYEEAVATCEAGLQRHPAYMSARVTLGRALLEMERFEDARGQLEQVLRLAPENLAAIRGLAEIHQRRGPAPESAESYAAPETPEQAPAEPVAPPALELAPIEPVKLSAVEPVQLSPIKPVTLSPIEPVTLSPIEPVQRSPIEPVHLSTVAPVQLSPVAPDPDEAAIPALEAFLAAIHRARPVPLPSQTGQ